MQNMFLAAHKEASSALLLFKGLPGRPGKSIDHLVGHTMSTLKTQPDNLH